MTVTLDQTLNSQTANDGLGASVAAPVTVGTVVVRPIGTKAKGTIVTVQSAGRFKGNAVLQLTLDSIHLNGAPYPIQTSEFEDAGKGRGKRTAVGAGGGTVLGAILGAQVGGGALRQERWQAAAREPLVLRSPARKTSCCQPKCACIFGSLNPLPSIHQIRAKNLFADIIAYMGLCLAAHGDAVAQRHNYRKEHLRVVNHFVELDDSARRLVLRRFCHFSGPQHIVCDQEPTVF